MARNAGLLSALLARSCYWQSFTPMSSRTAKRSSASSRRARRREASGHTMKKGVDTARDLRALKVMRDTDIDTSDIPEIVDWNGAERGRFYRPVKQMVTIRLDAEVVAWFKARDGKYQTAVNRALREYMLARAGQPSRRRSAR